MEVKKELSDNELYDYNTARKAINGDRESYEKFFKNHKESVCFVLLKIIRNKKDSEALVSEVFENSFNILSEYPIQLPFSTWLFKITVEIAEEFLQVNKKHKKSPNLL